MTLAQFHQVERAVGSMTEDQVRRILGPPERTGSLTVGTGEQPNCWFYSQAGPLLTSADRGDKAAVCFNGVPPYVAATQSSFAQPTVQESALMSCIRGKQLTLIPARQFREPLTIAGKEPLVVEGPDRSILFVFVYDSQAAAASAAPSADRKFHPARQTGNVVIAGSEVPSQLTPIEDCIYSAA